MEIIEYNDKYINDIKSLLKELQEYIVSIDPYKFNIINEGYEDICFNNDYKDVLDNNGMIYIGVDNNKVLGLIIGIIKEAVYEYDYERKNRCGVITELIVSKNNRKSGIGKELIKKMEEYFIQNNCKTIDIDVFGYNDNAINFYLKNGYHTRMMTVSKKIEE